MSKENNIAASKKFGEAVNTGNFDDFKNLVAENSVDHDPAPGQVAGPEGYIRFFKTMKTAFPDMQVEVETMVADNEQVAFAYTLTGTHKGDFNGIPATDKTIKVRGMQISKFEDGKMTERWGSSDELGILKQIGAK